MAASANGDVVTSARNAVANTSYVAWKLAKCVPQEPVAMATCRSMYARYHELTALGRRISEVESLEAYFGAISTLLLQADCAFGMLVVCLSTAGVVMHIRSAGSPSAVTCAELQHAASAATSSVHTWTCKQGASAVSNAIPHRSRTALECDSEQKVGQPVFTISSPPACRSTGKAAWIASTTFLLLVAPLIVEMDREQQMVEFENQSLGALTGK